MMFLGDVLPYIDLSDSNSNGSTYNFFNNNNRNVVAWTTKIIAQTNTSKNN